MAYEVRETSRKYAADPVAHMSTKPFGTDKRGGTKPPLSPDRSGRRQRGRRLSRPITASVASSARSITP